MAKPTLKIENSNEDKVRLVAFGDWAILHAREVKSLLMQALSPVKEIHLDLTDVTALDVAGIQLAFAWKNEIRKHGVQVEVSMPADSSLLDLLEKSRITKIF